jgi:hypothetical protein
VRFRDDDPDQRVWASPDRRAACQAQANRCNLLLRESLALEQDAETAMSRRRESVAATLAEVQSGATARSAYASIPRTIASLEVQG